jgi:IS1 family transposase
VEMKLTAHHSTDGQIWQCERTINGTRHRQKLSIRHGSIFEDSHLSIKDVVLLMYEWACSTSLQQTSIQLNISEKTVLRWHKSFRKLAAWMIKKQSPAQIGGPGDIVELDECQIGRRKHHRGRIPNEVWIFGAVVRESKPFSCFIEVVKRRDKTTLTEIIRRKINPLSRIISDGWKAYQKLHEEEGLEHNVVNHSQNFVSADDKTTHTQNIENLWRCLRRFLNSKEAYKRKHLLSYINEFIFRKHHADPFDVILSTIEMKYTLL